LGHCLQQLLLMMMMHLMVVVVVARRHKTYLLTLVVVAVKVEFLLNKNKTKFNISLRKKEAQIKSDCH
jgi:nitrate/nitrite transporter NarK